MGRDIVAEIAPRAGELVIAKAGASAFFGTHLAAHLIKRGVDTVLMAGCTTSGCVRASVIDSHDYGFRTIVVEECVFDRALVPHRANLFDMEAKYAGVESLAEVLAYLEQPAGRCES